MVCESDGWGHRVLDQPHVTILTGEYSQTYSSRRSGRRTTWKTGEARELGLLWGSEVAHQRTPSSDIKQFTVTYLCASHVERGTHAVSSEWARNAKKVGDTDRHVDLVPDHTKRETL